MKIRKIKICFIFIVLILFANIILPSLNLLSTIIYASSEIILTFSNDGITETSQGDGYTITGTTLEITSAGTYHIKGSCTEGNIEVNKGVTGVILILDNLTLKSSETAPIVIKKQGASATIQLVGTSTITDAENPNNETSTDNDIADAFEGAAIKVKSASTLKINGSGTLNIDSSSCKNGIKGGATSSIKINGGTINVNAANSGIACDGTLKINKGTLNVTAKGDGIKSEPDEDDTESAGEIIINGGTITINAEDDGIQVTNSLTINGGTVDIDANEGDGIQSDKDITINYGVFDINAAKNDGIQTARNLVINDGNFTIKTYKGYTTSKYTGDTSCKGLKASSDDDSVEENITITGGTFNINTTDDAIHSDEHITITGGTFEIKTGDDGVHADTSLVLGKTNGLERDPDIAINNCYEGLEAGTVYAYSGRYYIIATDDAINAAGGSGSEDIFKPGGRPGQNSGGSANYNLYIYGGSYYVEVSSGDHDGLDSNGGLYLLGGNITINGGTAPLDSDGTMQIKGATVFLAGSDPMGDVSLSNDSQTYISQGLRNSGMGGNTPGGNNTSVSAGKIVNVYDSNNNIVYSQKLKVASSILLYSSPSTTSSYTFNTSASSITSCKSDSWKHSWNNGVITTQATENSDGVITYTCSSCKTTEKQTYHYYKEIEIDDDDDNISDDDDLTTGYLGTFKTDEGVKSIDVYYTQDYTKADEENVTETYARASDTGKIDVSGSGQINFLVNLKDGYIIDELPEVSGDFKAIKGSDDTGVENLYRITKIKGDLTIEIKTQKGEIKKEQIVPEINGYESSYEYTGSKIEPEITVNIYGESTILTKGTDYTVKYGNNTNVGTGTITISSVSTSNYTFSDTSVSFNIVAKKINDENVNAPSSMKYTGEKLTPTVSVGINDVVLTKDKDYTVEISGQEGKAGDYITVTITGIGNYKGTVVKKILISDKPSQTLYFTETSTTKTYGDKNFTQTVTCSAGDGKITYSSSNTNVATVNNSGTVTILSAGTTTITAMASETTNYSETLASYVLTVNKKELTVSNIIISDKQYDGTTKAEIKEIKFTGEVVKGELKANLHYTFEANFDNEQVGNNKTVTVKIKLNSGTIADNYMIKETTYITTGNILKKEENDDNETKKLNVTSENYIIDIENSNYIKDVKTKTQMKDFLKNIETNAESIVVKDKNGKEVTDTSLIATGMTVDFNNGEKVLVVVIYGDINGDGEIKTSDLSNLKKAIIGTKTLEGAYAEAADLNNDGKIKASDISKIKKILIGL